MFNGHLLLRLNLINETILCIIISTAGMPKTWELKDWEKSPLNRNAIEFPSPQPGQCSKPKLDRGQIVKWVCNGFINIARYRSAKIQIKPSRPNNLKELINFIKRLFCWVDLILLKDSITVLI